MTTTSTIIDKTAQGYAGDISVQTAFDWWQSGQAALVDIRTPAEIAWVGFVPNTPVVPWKIWPGMVPNPQYDEQLAQAIAQVLGASDQGAKVMLLCRSGLRSIPAAQRAQQLGFTAYNVLEGFEGDPDAQAHRNSIGGWRAKGLPWKQN